MKGDAERALPMLDESKCQVNARLADIGFFGNLVLEIFLCVPRHDEQAPVRQSFCEGNTAILTLKAKQTLNAQTDRCDDRTHFRLGISV